MTYIVSKSDVYLLKWIFKKYVECADIEKNIVTDTTLIKKIVYYFI